VTRGPDPGDDPEPEDPFGEPAGGEGRPPLRPGQVRPIGLALVAAPAALGLVVGWLLRPMALRLGNTPPTIGWVTVVALALVAVVVAGTAWATHRALHVREERMAAHQAVNRLLLAKAGALTGALVAGGYLGYALSWVGLTDTELAEQRLLRALVAGVAGIALVVASLFLERACRVRGDRSAH
jgi:uncharacterized membrane protein